MDLNHLILHASRSLENGSVTCRIPTVFKKIASEVIEKIIMVTLKWEIRDGVLVLEKGDSPLFQVPIAQLLDLHAAHLKNQAPTAPMHLSCCEVS